MAEYIEREALETDLHHRLNFLMADNREYDHYTSGFDEAVTRVENFPAADVAPVVHGKWIVDERHRHDPYCSVCDYEPLTGKKTPFCPNCGADMRGDNHD